MSDRLDKKGRHKRRAVVEAWYSQGCQICGEARRPAMEAAHRKPKGEGDFQINVLVNSYGMPMLLRELAKCVCLCATCHRLVDAGWLNMPELGSETIDSGDPA